MFTAILASGMNAKGQPTLSLCAAARIYEVKKTTLTARYNGRQTHSESHASQQKLSPPQETVLKEWIKVMGWQGVPLNFTAIADYASVIVDEPVLINWARTF